MDFQSSKEKVPITDVKVRLVEHGTDRLLAWASCVIAGAIRLDNIAIRRSSDGSLYLTYPAKRTPHGEKYYYFHPISTEAANCVQEAVLSRLAALARPSAQLPDTGDG